MSIYSIIKGVSMRLKQFSINLVGFIAYYTGITEVFLRKVTNKNFAYVVMGHRLSDEDPFFFEGCNTVYFDKSIRKLRKYFDFIGMNDFYRHLSTREPFKRASIVLTFDDGFRDNYTVGFPIFKRYRIPAIIYLTVNSIQGQELPWSQRLGYALYNTNIEGFELSFNGGRKHLAMKTRSQRENAFKNLSRVCERLDYQPREELLAEIKTKLSVDLPMDMMLTWKMIAEMTMEGIEFGSHTLSHPLLANINQDEARNEILISKQIIENEINKIVEHFAFPAGSMNDGLRDYVKEIGFKTSYIKRNVKKLNFRNTHETDPHGIRRIGLHNAPHYVIVTEFAGVFDFLRHLLKVIRK